LFVVPADQLRTFTVDLWKLLELHETDSGAQIIEPEIETDFENVVDGRPALVPIPARHGHSM
jgi:hypothetical protein